MRLQLSFLLVLISSNFLQAQNVGIGTINPNPSAQLDVASTNKGFLAPRMTSTNRGLITNPVNGLIVYDTTFNRLYQYQDGIWRYLINNTYWTQSSTRNWTYNSSDSVGIGTTAPTHRLDVNGNVRVRADIIADDDVTAGGAVQGTTLVSTGNIIAGGAATVIGDISTTSDLLINNTSATLQLKAASVNKGYFQLSGDNVRLGTNSGNSAGNLIIRMNGTDRVYVDETGNVGIGITSPTEKLDVNGNINFSGKLTSSQTGNASLTPLCWGMTADINNGGIRRGTGNLSASRIGEGHYRITCPGITATSIAIVSAYAFGVFVAWDYYGPGQMDVRTSRLTSSGTIEPFDQLFSFIIY